jgi:hypothetical protein
VAPMREETARGRRYSIFNREEKHGY